jgi:acyl carrier protein
VGAGQEQDENSTAPVQRRDFPLLGAYVAPRSPTEQTLAEMFRGAFSMDQVSVDDSFEDLGGDSLIALTICADIEKSFGVSVPIMILERSPTIEQLALRIDDLVSRPKA